jgi:hypothetical protein
MGLRLDVIGGGLLAAGVSTAALAQEVSRSPCWEITVAQGVPPYSTVLLDKCSGKSWFMIKQPLQNTKTPGGWDLCPLDPEWARGQHLAELYVHAPSANVTLVADFR